MERERKKKEKEDAIYREKYYYEIYQDDSFETSIQISLYMIVISRLLTTSTNWIPTHTIALQTQPATLEC